jgi:hypothetical protein
MNNMKKIHLKLGQDTKKTTKEQCYYCFLHITATVTEVFSNEVNSLLKVRVGQLILFFCAGNW